MRDFCGNCAPYWWDIPICSLHEKKVKASGYCEDCKKFYDLSP